MNNRICKLVLATLIFVIAASVALSFAACKKGDDAIVTNISVESGKAIVEIGSFNINDYMLIITYADGSTKSMALRNEMLDAAQLEGIDALGVHKLKITVGGVAMIYPVTVTKKSFSMVRFEDKICLYDGNEKSLTLSKLPLGAEAIYDTDVLSYTEKGAYTITVTVSCTDYETESFTATLYITDEIFAGSAISFENVTETYDGTEKFVRVVGAPKEASVSYDIYNKYVDSGIYSVTATVTMAGENEWVRTAVLTINKADYDLSKLKWVPADAECVYDGSIHYVVLEGVPDGVTAAVEGDTGINAGVYTATAEFVYDEINHNPIILNPYEWSVAKADFDMSGVSFKNATFVYDGEEHGIFITGQLPEGVTVNYSNNALTYVEVSDAEASFECDEQDEQNYNPIASLYAVIKIVKADYNMSNVSFNSATYVYDGLNHKLQIAGTLPVGISCVYYVDDELVTEVALTEVGSISVVARFVDDNEDGDNYNSISDRTATLSVIPAPLSGIFFSGGTFTYDGTQKNIYLSGMPEGMQVEYLDNGKIDAGEYDVTALIIQQDQQGKRHTLATISAVMVIKKAVYDTSGVTFAGAEFVADGSAHSLKAEGALPQGVAVTYLGNEKTVAGEYTVTASFAGNPNYEDIAPMSAILSIVSFDIDKVSFESVCYPYADSPVYLKVDDNELPGFVTVQYPNGNMLENPGTLEVTADFYSCEDGVSSVYLGSRTAVLTVVSVSISSNLLGVSLLSQSFIYDGTQHRLEVIGIDGTELDELYYVTYDDNTLTESGEKTVTASIIEKNSEYELCMLTATITVRQAVPDISFHDAVFIYDGERKDLLIEGELPNEIGVSYLPNNYGTLAGSLTVTASFYYIDADTEHNYSLPDEMVAVLTIVKRDYDMSGIVFDSRSFFYDGIAHSIEIEGILPENVTVTYDGGSQTAMGSVTVTANFYSLDESYNAPASLAAELVIVANPLFNIRFPGATYTYSSNTERTLSLKNADTVGVIQYNNNVQSQAGYYDVTASIGSYDTETGDFIGFYTFESNILITKAKLNPAAYTLTDAVYTYDGTPRSLELAGVLPEELEVVYSPNKKTNAGIYTVTASIVSKEGCANYILPDDYTAVLTINKKPLTVVFTGQTYVEYTGKAQKNVTCTTTNRAGNDKVSITLTYSGNMIDCGEYTVTASINNSNYILETGNVYFVTIVRELHIVLFKQKDLDTVVYLADKEPLTDENIPELIERMGYNAEWEPFKTNILENTTIEAIYSPIVYKLTYVLGGGYNNIGNTETYTIETREIILSDAAKSGGAVFNGWYTTETYVEGTRIYAIEKGSWGDIRLYANWIDCPITVPETFFMDCSGPVPVISRSVNNAITGIDLIYQFSVSADCGWKLYEDYVCATELAVNDQLQSISLEEGDNVAYILVYRTDGSAATRYILNIHRNHNYSYRVNDGSGRYSVVYAEEGTCISTLSHIEKEGYSFSGWTANGIDVTLPYTIDRNDIEFNAKYDELVYSVYYNLAGGENNENNPERYTVTTGFILRNPVKAHYRFEGWYVNGDDAEDVLVNFVYGVGNVYLTAAWSPVEYTVTYTLYGGENHPLNEDTYTIEDVLDFYEPTRLGYAFDGWYTESSFTYKVSAEGAGCHGNIHLYAKWTIIEYNILYELEGGTNAPSNPDTYTVESTVFLSFPTRDGYEFMGWHYFDEFDEPTLITMIRGRIGDIELTAYWSEIKYDVVYYYGANSSNPSEYTVISDALTLSAPSELSEGYEFKGWYLDSGFEAAIEAVGGGMFGDISVYAKYSAIVYDITYHYSPGVNSDNNPSQYTVEGEYDFENAVYDEARLTFGGWYIDESFEYPITGVCGNTGDLELYARWLSGAELDGVYTEHAYTLTFNANGGGAVPKQIVTNNSQLSIPAPSKNGYLFTGWYDDPECLSYRNLREAAITEDLTLYAGWTRCDYDNHQFIPTGGTTVTASTFSGAYTSSNSAFYFYADASSVTLYYRNSYSGGRTYYFIYDETAGREIDTYGYYTNTSYNSLAINIVRGHLYRIVPYAYNGSYTTMVEIYLANGKHSVTAACPESGTYAEGIVFNSKNKIVYITYGSQGFEIEIPYKAGYDFVGWYTVDDVQITDGDGKGIVEWNHYTNDEILLQPQYCIAEYDVVYKAGDEKILDSGNEVSYTVESHFDFIDYIFDGYTFEGWYKDWGLTELIERTNGLHEHLTVYAKLTKEININDRESYTVTFDSKGGLPVDPQIIDNGTALTLPMPIRNNYVFKGWYSDSQCEELFDAFDSLICSDIVLYAGWTTCNYYQFIPEGGSIVSASTYSGVDNSSNKAFYFYADASSVTLYYRNNNSSKRTYYHIYDETAGREIDTYGYYTNTSYNSLAINIVRGHLYRIVPYAYSGSYTTTVYIYLEGDYAASVETLETDTYGLTSAMVSYNCFFQLPAIFGLNGYYALVDGNYEKITNNLGASIGVWNYDSDVIYTYDPED